MDIEKKTIAKLFAPWQPSHLGELDGALKLDIEKKTIAKLFAPCQPSHLGELEGTLKVEGIMDKCYP